MEPPAPATMEPPAPATPVLQTVTNMSEQVSQAMDLSEEQVWEEGEKYFTQALEELQKYTAKSEQDDASKEKIYQLLSVIEDSKAEGSTALKQFLDNNRSLLVKAKEQIGDVGKSFGSAVPGNMLDNIDKLKDVMMGEDQESVERLGKAKVLASHGQDYLQELIVSQEAKELETEGLAALNEIRNTDEGKRLERAMSELIGAGLGTTEGEELNLNTIKQKLLSADLNSHLSNGIKTASAGVAELDLEDISKTALEQDKTGLLKKFAETNKDNQADQLNEASAKANDLLQKIGDPLGGTVEEAMGKANEMVSQDVDLEYVSKNADEVLENTSTLLVQARKQRRGQRALSQSLELLRTGMSKGYVQDAVKTFGSAEMVALGKKALTDGDQVAKDALLEQVRCASVEFISSTLPNVEIPPISGFRENVAYTIDGLDLSGFNIGKDCIQIQPGDFSSVDWDGEVLKLTCEGISAKVNELNWSYRQGYFPYLSGAGVADCDIEGLKIVMGFKLVRRSPTQLKKTGTEDEGESGGVEGVGEVKDNKNTTTDDENQDKQEQEEKEGVKQTEKAEANYPVHLVLASKSFEVENLELTIAGSTITWVYNMLLGLFADVVRDYIVTNVLESLEEATDEWLATLNEASESVRLALVLQNVFNVPTTKLDIVGPPIPRAERDQNRMVLIQSDLTSGTEFDVDFLTTGPLGMRIGTDASNNDGRSIVTQFIKNGTSGRSLAEESGLIQMGDIPIALNGKKLQGLNTSAIINQMRIATRPLKIKFLRMESASKSSQGKQAVIEQVFGPGPLGLELTANTNIAGSVPRGAMIRRFKPLRDGKPGPAERCGTWVVFGFVLTLILCELELKNPMLFLTFYCLLFFVSMSMCCCVAVSPCLSLCLCCVAFVQVH